MFLNGAYDPEPAKIALLSNVPGTNFRHIEGILTDY